jgi:uncharacterized membrane protein
VTLYAVLRAAHVLGAVLLLGNVIVTGVWAALGMRARDVVAHQAVARAVIITDWCFTVPGGALLVVSGMAMAHLGRLPLLETPFVRTGLIALSLSTGLWLGVLIPLQVRWERATDRHEAERLFRWWSVVGWSATVPLLIGLWGMASRR